LERQRRQEQADLAALSTPGKLSFVHGGHEELENPDAIITAFQEMVSEWRKTY
jgi:hypothetical protein